MLFYYTRTGVNQLELNEWLFDRLKKLNQTEEIPKKQGFTRLSFTDEEWQSRQMFREIAESLELEVREDEVGNVIARWNPTEAQKDAPALAIGSHLDTVVNGGGYDGVAGVLCGLGAVKVLKESDFIPIHPIEIISFVSEESARFPISTLGSKAMTGTLDLPSIENVTDKAGITIKEAIESRGLVFEDIVKAERNATDFINFVELHIEQGTRIETAEADYGAVTAIACPIRLKVSIEGMAGHTGTTPMNQRQDAFVAAAPLISFVSEYAKQLSAENDVPLVATVSTAEVYPNAMNVIPGHVVFGIDIRSVDDRLKEKMKQAIEEKCQHIEADNGVNIGIDILVNNPSIKLHEEVHQELLDAGKRSNLTSFTLESGAGHDVMNMVHKCPAGLMFIRCKDGISHHPDEYASIEDLEIGVNVLTSYLLMQNAE